MHRFVAAVLASLTAGTALGQPTFQPIALNGEQAPGFDPGVTLSNFSSSSLAMSDNGNAVFRAFASGQGNVLFHVSPSGDVQPYLLENTQAPGLPAGVNLNTIQVPRAVVNDSGEVVFTGRVTGTGVTLNSRHAIFAGDESGFRAVARGDDAVPGSPTLAYGSIYNDYTQFNSAGHAAFWCQLASPSLNGIIMSEGDGQGLRSVATKNEQVPGMPVGTTFQFFLGNTLNIDDAGRTSFISEIELATGGHRYAVIREDETWTPTVVAQERAPIPGHPATSEFNEFGLFSPKANSAGEYALISSITEDGVGSHAVCLIADGVGVSLVARKGETAPGLPQGVTYAWFHDGAEVFALNNTGRVAFVAALEGTGVNLDNRYALFAETGQSGPVMIARNDDHATGHPAGTYFDDVAGSRVRFNDANQLAFIITLSDGTDSFKGLYATDEFGVLHHVVSVGDTIDIDPDPEQTNLVTITRLDNLELANSGEILIAVSISGSSGLIKYSGVVACPADTNHDGILSPADFSAWVQAFNTQSPACDQNNDGECTPADFSAWVANYNAGC
ncbi:MAG: hypothetical protein KDA31_02225 [Phycisphaerales bacterium]|nr:hypothetical protein [Phycisphaerales bacterium]MCB9835647.1 hypothetical protein [Phycisphaera sp.]